MLELRVVLVGKLVISDICGKVKHELQVTSSNPRVRCSSSQVMSLNLRVTSSNPQVSS